MIPGELEFVLQISITRNKLVLYNYLALLFQKTKDEKYPQPVLIFDNIREYFFTYLILVICAYLIYAGDLVINSSKL